MADWYVSSTKFAAVTAFVASHAYSVGDLVKATAPASGKEYVWRCTTAGTSSTEPTWSTAYANNQTITSGGATFTNVTGQSTYGWNAAAGTLYSISNSNSNRPAAGDRVFLSSDHSETFAANTTYGFNSTTHAFALIQFISVNKAGSVPPVAADITNGATLTLNATGLFTLVLEAYTNNFWQGITISVTGTSNSNISCNSTGAKSHYFKNCAISMTTTGLCRFGITAGQGRVTFDNTTVQFSTTGGYIGAVGGGIFEFNWINTPSSAILGSTFPTGLFQSVGAGNLITCRGVDLSAITGTLLSISTGGPQHILLESCKIAASVSRVTSGPGVSAFTADEIELVNCWDSSNVLNERYTLAGTITTDRSTTLSGGAQDDVNPYSLKMASASRSDFAVYPLDCFSFDVENILTGSRTATVEIISSGTLNNTDIKLLLEYMGTSGNPVASWVDTLTTILDSAAALTSSTVTWNNPPSTPQKQKLSASFSPQRSGRVRGLVRLGKTSANVWVNPQITIT